MKKFEDTMKNLRAEMRLSQDEKERMRARVHEYMAHTPRRLAEANTTTVYTSISWFMHYHRIGATFVIFALLFGSGVGVSYAATDALPGETLYAVKELKEDLAQRLIIDEVERTEYAIERAQNRLREIEMLAAKGKLDAETEALATEKFAVSVQRAQERIALLETTDAAEAEALHIAFVVGLEARADALATPTRAATGIENDARTRIAHIAQAQLASRFDTTTSVALMAYGADTGEEHVNDASQGVTRDARSAKSALAVEMVATNTVDGVAASTPAPEVGMMAMVQEDDEHGGVGGASVAMMAEESSKTAPATVTALMRTLVKEKEKLVTLQKAATTAVVRGKLEVVLKNVNEKQDAIAVALTTGDYVRAEVLIQEALRTIYKTHASLDASLEIDTSASATPVVPADIIETLPPDAPNVIEEAVPISKERSLF